MALRLVFDVRRFAMKTNCLSPTNAFNVKAIVLACLVSFVLSLSFVNSAEAGTLFTYSGKGIQSKASVNTASLSSGKTCYVQHSQTRVYGQSGTTLKVSVQKQSGLSWDTVGSRSFLNDVTNKTFSTYCSKGKYRLYFQSSESKYKFNINGKFYY